MGPGATGPTEAGPGPAGTARPNRRGCGDSARGSANPSASAAAALTGEDREGSAGHSSGAVTTALRPTTSTGAGAGELAPRRPGAEVGGGRQRRAAVALDPPPPGAKRLRQPPCPAPPAPTSRSKSPSVVPAGGAPSRGEGVPSSSSELSSVRAQKRLPRASRTDPEAPPGPGSPESRKGPAGPEPKHPPRRDLPRGAGRHPRRRTPHPTARYFQNPSLAPWSLPRTTRTYRLAGA